MSHLLCLVVSVLSLPTCSRSSPEVGEREIATGGHNSFTTVNVVLVSGGVEKLETLSRTALPLIRDRRFGKVPCIRYTVKTTFFVSLNSS